MKINTLIIDDDPLWRIIIGKFVSMAPILNLVGSCASAMNAYALLTEQEVDLLICDIAMPDMSGLTFIKTLRQPPLVIFVTAHRNYALDCYEVSPVDFLLKPLDQQRFLSSIEKVRHRMEAGINALAIEPYFFVRENLNYIQLFYYEVLYMKAQENFVQIVTTAQTYLPSLSMAKLEEQLKGDVFLRVHRSYLVNRSAIRQILKNDIVLVNDEQIPIGDQYRTRINRNHLDSNLISR